MKNLFFSLLLVSISQLALAQTYNVTGTIKDKLNNPLHLAFVQDKHYKYAAYTDSTGYFTLTVHPDSKIRISCFGYRDTLVNINNQVALTIAMKEAVNINGSNLQATNTDPINKVAFRDEIMENGPVIAVNVTRGILPLPAVHYGENPKNIPVPVSSVQPTVVMTGLSKTGQPVPGQGLVTAAQYSGNGNGVDMAQGSIFPVFSPKEATVGSRYFFPAWVHGYVINAQDSLIQNPGFFFNYDKMGGGLLLTKDKNAAIQIDKDLVKSFTLFDNTNTPYMFEDAPAIDTKHYTQVLATGNKYKIYKSISTKFVKANYASDGIMATGHDYDEFVSENVYYVLNEQNNQLQKIDLKKKAIKAAFSGEADKLGKFMADHSDDTIDDTYLSSLGAYMNE
jgi:hypothetical protein